MPESVTPKSVSSSSTTPRERPCASRISERADSIEGTETGAQDRPLQDALIERVEVHEG